MKSFIHRGLRLEYSDSGSGLPLVFLHGLGGSVRQIESTVEPLEGVRLICLNQQGHGSSQANWESFCFDSLADDALALLDELQIEKAAFAGISMGAGVCLNLALRYPHRVSRLLLIRNAWTEKPMAEKLIRAYADLGRCLENGGKEAFFESEGWQTVKEPSAYTRNAFLLPFSEEHNVNNPKKYLLLPPDAPAKSREEISSVSCPCTILANDSDLCHPLEYGEYLHRLIKSSELYIIPDKDSDGAGHKRLLNQHLKNWISAKQT